MANLILSRRLGERIVINGDIWITIHSLSSSRVNVGIDAPREVTVDREEIHAKRGPKVRRELAEPIALSAARTETPTARTARRAAGTLTLTARAAR